MLNQALPRWLAISCLAFLTVACGGGGGSGGSNSGSSSGGSNSPTSGAPSNSPNSPSNSPSTPSTPSTPSVVRNVALSWTIPTTREDGSPLTANAISAYRLFYTRDNSAASDDTIVVISNGSATNTNISLALAGTYTFAITAVDLHGNESPLSAPASVTIN